MKNKSTKVTIILFTSLIVIIILSLRVSWLNYFQVETLDPAESGFIDLTDAVLSEGNFYSLEGEWHFHPEKWVDPGNITETSTTADVPSNWPDELLNYDHSMIGKGSYQLQVDLPEDFTDEAGIRFYEIIAAAEVYVNGQLVYKRNDLNHSWEDRGLKRGPIDIYFKPPENEILNIVIHVSNFNQTAQGGIHRDIFISSAEQIRSLSFLSKALQLSVGIIFILHALYAFTLYFLQKKYAQTFLVTFGFMLLLFASGVFMDDETLYMPPLTMSEHYRLLLMIFLTTLFVMFKIISNIFNVSKWNNRVILILFISLLGIALLFPYENLKVLVRLIIVLYPIIIGLMLYVTVSSIVKGNKYGYFILAFLLAYSSNIFWGALIKTNVIQIPFYPFDFIFSMVALIGLVLKRHSDVTGENEKQADIIIQNEKSKDSFLANTAHELRNPLHGIMVINETLLNHLHTKPKEAIEKDLILSHKIALQMKYILNDLQDYTLLKEQRLRIDRQPVNIQAVITTITDILMYQRNRNSVQFRINLPSDLPAAHGDEQRLFQIFYNVLHNAVKFTEEGEIVITASSSENVLHITIADSGGGIDKKDLERVLNPYEQGAGSSQGGIGLGLNISRELTLLHDGEFSINSLEREGVTVHIKLPAADGKTISNEIISSGNPNKMDLASTYDEKVSDLPKVLVVDDNPLNLDILEKALYPEFNVVKASSGEEGLVKLSRETFYLVISDVMMAEMSGYEFTRNVRKHYDLAELPILHLTARQHTDDLVAGLNSGANDYVSKPIERDELLARVRTLINMKRAAYEKVETEAAWLQAQIKPHFLYNTMNAIASLSQTDPDRMIDLLYEFGSYLKNSFQLPPENGLISLNEELKIIKPYLYIEQSRFPEKLEVIYDIQNADTIFIPRLAIQTLVENAVNHGALKNKGEGIVRVTSRYNGQKATIVISDNGYGNAQKLTELLENQQTTGVGLVNAHTRIKFINGKGLTIEKNSYGGISIIISLPGGDHFDNN
ncbi:ATP-binding protein [Salipaludibacillus aurantiacus]|uniref:histidine kinase n=1 Tax=Salipaludibacillus aurantiacus TaxID=1601833 RepID=A0A1H9UEZ6_9BACI|nr:ATP-binding protein [Salipaludibacillus aurantiacus]SES07929.1 Signal transduction histidine kinase [Salipaludibacillus aurantiacus]